MRTLPAAHLAHTLYQRLIVGGDNMSTVSRRSGLSVHKLYSVCEGKRHLLAEDLPAIFRGTNDLDLFSALCGAEDCGLVVTRAPNAAEALTTDRRSSALKVAAKAGELAGLVDLAEADGVITQQEREAISASITKLEQMAESLRTLLSVNSPVRSIKR